MDPVEGSCATNNYVVDLSMGSLGSSSMEGCDSYTVGNVTATVCECNGSGSSGYDDIKSQEVTTNTTTIFYCDYSDKYSKTIYTE